MTTQKPTGLELMRAPFPENQISILCRSTKKDNPKGGCKKCGGFHGLPAIALKYVGHAALTDRLLDADPNWTWEPLSVDANGLPALDRDGGLWIRLTVCGVTRLGYGDAQGKAGGDAMKERIGDALRNAAMRFGAALDLWHKGDLHADDEPEAAPAPKAEPAPAAVGTLPQKEVTDHIASIEAASTQEELFKVYAAAYRQAGKVNDTKALEDFTAAKNKRKTALEAATVQPEDDYIPE